MEPKNRPQPTPAYLAALAGFLHDLGKVGQRAYPPGIEGVREAFPEAESNFREENWHLWLKDHHQYREGEKVTWFSHYHVLWSGYLAEQLGLTDEWKPVRQAVLLHHCPTPNAPLSELLARADRLASGMDRITVPEKGDAWKTPLIPILKEVGLQVETGNGLSGEAGPDDDCGFPLGYGLELAEDKYPARGFPFPQPGQSLSESEYEKLWGEILNVAKELRFGGDPDIAVSQVAGLVEWYCWPVHDSSYGTVNDVSLADHSRAVATVAACLARVAEERTGSSQVGEWAVTELFGNYPKEARKSEPEGVDPSFKEDIFRLVVGDLKGIQRFIYDVFGEGTAKQLRARSFTVEIWCDRLAAYLCREVGIPEACRIYATGGKFLLLLPNLTKLTWKDSSENRHQGSLTDYLRYFQDLVNEDIEQTFDHRVPLRLVLASVPLSQLDLIKPGKLREKLDELMKLLNLASGHPYWELPGEFFSPLDPPAEYISASTTEIRDETGIREEIDKYFTGLGRKLTRVSFLIQKPDRSPADGKRVSDNKLDVPIPGTEWEVTTFSDLNSSSGKGNFIISLNQYKPEAAGFRWYASARVPAWPKKEEAYEQCYWGALKRLCKEKLRDRPEKGDEEPENGNPLTFDQLATAAELFTGFGRLGVLRMDVDNLGYIISRGLDQYRERLAERLGKNPDEINVYSLSRLASLSSSLVRFFSGLLPKLLEKIEYEQPACGQLSCKRVLASDLVIIIYAGGDDCFLVGPWDLLAQVAFEIREFFHCWTCGNPDLGLSGGLYLMDGHYPIRVGAEKAGEEEERAKSKGSMFHLANQGASAAVSTPTTKDHFAFLGAVEPWWCGKKSCREGGKGGWQYIIERRKRLEQLVCGTKEEEEVDSRRKSAIIRMLGKVAMAYLQGEEVSKRLSKGIGPNTPASYLRPLPGFWKAMLHYAVNRQPDELREKLQEAIADELIPDNTSGQGENQSSYQQAKKELCGNREPIELLPTIVRWADFRTRRG